MELHLSPDTVFGVPATRMFPALGVHAPVLTTVARLLSNLCLAAIFGAQLILLFALLPLLVNLAVNSNHLVCYLVSLLSEAIYHLLVLRVFGGCADGVACLVTGFIGRGHQVVAGNSQRGRKTGQERRGALPSGVAGRKAATPSVAMSAQGQAGF